MDIALVMLWQNPVLGGALYFLPLILAVARPNPARWEVLWMNLLLGWTIIGWCVALWLAVSGISRPRDSAPEAPPPPSPADR